VTIDSDRTTSPARGKLHLKCVLLLVWKAAPGLTLFSAAMLSLQAWVPLLQIYLMKLTIDAVTTSIGTQENETAFQRVAILVCLTGAAALAAALFASLAKWVSQIQADRVADHVQDLLHAKSVELDLEYYESSRFHDTLHRAQQEAPYRPVRMVKCLSQLIQAGVALAGIAALLFSCHWGITTALAAAAAPGAFLRLRAARREYDRQQERSATERAVAYMNWLITGESHAKELRLFDLGPSFMERSRELRRELRREKSGVAYRAALNELVAQGGATLAIFGSLAFIAHQAVQGSMTLGDMVMVYQALQRGQGYLREILNSVADLYEDNLFVSNFHDFLDLKATVSVPPAPVPLPRPMREGIVFDHVGFQYPTGAGMALRDVSLTIHPGQVVALVGENGSGKTTLVKLLCRLYDPTVGKITWDGIDLRLFEAAALRREIGIIFQDYAHYYMTARDNIRMGNVQAPRDDEKITAAAKRSGAHDILSGLLQGYDTMLGHWFGSGTELSMGQWQRVALARAFLRDAQVLILDEPTSSLDARAECELLSNFRWKVSGCTTILISHRFSSIRMADIIFVLKDGRIAEAGNHEELLSRGEMYAKLFEAQARPYT
jgi:ATP-binding cassette subfamily B protein